MPKEEWGVKRVCPNCAQRFYDLQADPMTCPECGSSFTVESLLSDRPKALGKSKSENDAEELIDSSEDVLAGDAAIEADDDLLDDDDDENVSLDELADVASDDEEN